MYCTSDKVQAVNFLSKILVGNGNSFFCWAFHSISDQICKSVRVLDWRWHFDGARNIIVRVTQLVSQQLDLVWMSTSCIMHNYVVSWAYYTLSACLTDQEKVINIIGYNSLVNNCAWSWVHQSTGIVAIKESLINALVNKHDY